MAFFPRLLSRAPSNVSAGNPDVSSDMRITGSTMSCKANMPIGMTGSVVFLATAWVGHGTSGVKKTAPRACGSDQRCPSDRMVRLDDEIGPSAH